MQYLFFLISIFLLSACTPKYKVVKEYHPPKISSSSEVCIGLCATQRNVCETKCKDAFRSCQVKAHRVAKQRYAKKLQHYRQRLENYVDQVDDTQFDRSFINISYVGYGHPYYYHPRYQGYANNLFWYDPMPYYSSYMPEKPHKPSLAQEEHKAEAEMCDLECGCPQSFDNCYIGCGGQINAKRLCVENCP